ncbi:MAG: DUF427 domain-containing protein [Gemmatimonadetes bacterium]|nr:DUF427 domain-containing protein [Gemmatimonadota bacterium]MBT7858838.1 DUF427 domain-containing protein [Gemmatimonadota bacterium]
MRVGDKVSENAVWNYPEPVEGCPNIAAYVAFYWDRVDAWYEGEEQLLQQPTGALRP